jgi:hypothetical protein
MSAPLTAWMSWEGGVDLVAATAPNLPMPNIIVHVARLVHTPLGSAASGLVFYQPDPSAAPALMGFVSTDPARVGSYFGPAIFADTPFQTAPVLPAQITIEVGADSVGATVQVAGRTLRTRLSGLGAAGLVHRAPAPMSPFWQQGVERPAAAAQLWVDGVEVPILVPPTGITGGPAAVFAPCGLYTR